jgi:N6-adenosine-specific RNA methylase IME4
MTVSYIAPDLFRGSLPVWPFGDLAPQAYQLIMADPPWRFELYSEAGAEKSADAHYRTMTLDAIAALPVADLARADCLLWLWATAPMLDQQLRVMQAWGFRFVTSGVWVKTTRRGRIGFGTGYVLRNAHEPFLLGVRGALQCARTVRSVVMGELREHSRKPEAAYAAAEALLPGARRCELFSRTDRPGWETWGDEAGKFASGDVGDMPTLAARSGRLDEGGSDRARGESNG